MTARFNVFVVHPDNFRCHLELTSEEGGIDVLAKGEAAIKWLSEHGYYPSLKTNDVLGKPISIDEADPWQDEEPEAEPQPRYVSPDGNDIVDHTPPHKNQLPGEHYTMDIVKLEVVPKPDNHANVNLWGDGRQYADLFMTNWEINKLVKMTGKKADIFAVAHDIPAKYLVEYVISDKKTSKGNYYRNVISMRPVA